MRANHRTRRRETSRTPTRGGSLWHRWGALSAIGLTAGLPTGVLLLAPAEVVVGMLFVVPAAFAVSGAILGTSQWFAVRYLARPGRWIALSAVGLAAGLTLGTIAVELAGGWIAGGPVRFRSASVPALAAAFFSLGAIAGLGLGAAQSLCLGARFGGSGRWVAANALALAIGMPAGLAAAEVAAGGVRTPLGIFVLCLVTALAWGFATGRVLEGQARAAARAFRRSQA